MEVATKQPITISNQSIINELKAYEGKPADALIEYVWNAFDANASRVDINYEFSSRIDSVSFGTPNVEIVDDGDGWDLSENSTIRIFLESKKRFSKKPFKSLPHGSKGVGRFTFFCFANSASWETVFEGNTFKLVLEKEDLNNYLLDRSSNESVGLNTGTKVSFDVSSERLHEGFFINTLKQRILETMSWFLMLYPSKAIYINGEKIDPMDFVAETRDDIIATDNKTVPLRMVRWKSPLANKENSKLYYIDDDGMEVFKRPTGLNNKADIFYHSAYVKCADFSGYIPSREELEGVEESNQIRIVDGNQSKLINDVKEKVYEKLINFRQPHIVESSEKLIEEWVKDDQYPDVTKYGVDPDQYHDLVRQTFISAPSIYLGVSPDHRKLILNLLASLLGSPDRDLILIILTQVYDLDAIEKESLKEILERTSLKNVLATIKEVEHRLQVIEDLDKILHDPDIYRETLEVLHLQKILNDSFWIFGDEFQLVMDTEGSIRKAIKKWAKTVLDIKDLNPESKSRKELDLLLSKKIEYGNGKILNIVVELKRPSLKLTDKEYSQLSQYRNDLLNEPACNGENMKWIFILMGNDYDKSIERRIESQGAWGEKDKGLTEHLESENTKIYVRKWTDVINGELRPRYRTLSEKLKLKLKDRESSTQIEIVDDLTSKS